jgi:ribose 1,5-bisphosphate isomerase
MVINKNSKFKKIVEDIKSIKIQGARNIAKKSLEAYSLIPKESSIIKLKSARPTEPMMFHVLDLLKKIPKKEILNHFDSAQEKINKEVLKLIGANDLIMTHCHSTNVVNALIYSKKNKKNFEVYNTETRPLFQGRKTSKELSKAKIPVTQFVDSAIGIALSKDQGTRKVRKVFLGADAILKKGVINKVGSGAISRLAKSYNIPVYIIADSWKFSNHNLPLEQRELNEVWDKAPKNIKIKNPAFEFIPKKYITKIVSDLGTLSYSEFLKKIKD